MGLCPPAPLLQIEDYAGVARMTDRSRAAGAEREKSTALFGRTHFCSSGNVKNTSLDKGTFHFPLVRHSARVCTQSQR
jgi:hypothetical protein